MDTHKKPFSGRVSANRFPFLFDIVKNIISTPHIFSLIFSSHLHIGAQWRYGHVCGIAARTVGRRIRLVRRHTAGADLIAIAVIRRRVDRAAEHGTLGATVRDESGTALWVA